MKQAIVLKIKNKKYRAASIETRPDGSFYFYFPNKKDYFVYSDFQPQFKRGLQTYTINKVKKVEYLNPYISFHSGKMITHLNAFDEKKDKVCFYSDSEKIDLVQMFMRNLYHPLFSICSPDKNLFNEYYKQKPDDFNFLKIGNINSILQFEFFLQGIYGEIDEKSLVGAEYRVILSKHLILLPPKPLAICMIVSTIKTKGDTKEIICQIC